ncbi:MAG: ABC transporter ATP-binding protein [Clostridiales bacterium]|nr:ABC transporter ATP-binding protein [Clostridiales bacterium]
MALLEIKDLCKNFGSVHAVDHVSLTIEKGEMLCLLGPSGCGKTTLLRILSGFLEADSGTVLMEGEDVTNLPPEKRPTALVFQNYALFPHLNVYENVSFGLKIKKMPSKEIKEKVAQAIKTVGLEGMESRAITQLSGGQQQRVALARALVMEPKMLLLDEPLSNLDAKLRVETRQQIRQLQQRLGITAVFVTHDQEEAMSMGDKIAILKHGVLQQIDNPMSLYRHPENKFVAGFLGTPAMNFLKAESKNGDVTISGVPVPGIVRPEEDGEYTLGVRPEDIKIGKIEGMVTIKGKVKSLELLGDHSLIYLSWEGQDICCRAGIQENLSPEDEIDLSFAAKDIKIFDNKTEAVLK